MASRRQTAFEVQGLRQSRWLIDVIAQDVQTAREQAAILLSRRGVDAVRVVREVTNVDLAISSSCVILERFKSAAPGNGLAATEPARDEPGGREGPGAREEPGDNDGAADVLLLDHAFWMPADAQGGNEDSGTPPAPALPLAAPPLMSRARSCLTGRARGLAHDWAGRISIGVAMAALLAIAAIRLNALF